MAVFSRFSLKGLDDTSTVVGDATRFAGKTFLGFETQAAVDVFDKFAPKFQAAMNAGDARELISAYDEMRNVARNASGLSPADLDRLTKDNTLLGHLRKHADQTGFENELEDCLVNGKPVDLELLAEKYNQQGNKALLDKAQEIVNLQSSTVASIPPTPVAANVSPVTVQTVTPAPTQTPQPFAPRGQQQQMGGGSTQQPQMGGSNNSGLQQQQMSGNGGGTPPNGNTGGFGTYQAPTGANAFQKPTHTSSGFGTYQAHTGSNAFQGSSFKVTSTPITIEDFIIPANEPTWLHNLVKYGDIKRQISYRITGDVLKPAYKNISNFDAEHKYVRPAVKEIDRIGMDTGFSKDVLTLQRDLYQLTERLRTNPSNAPLGKEEFVEAVKEKLSDFAANAENRKKAESFVQGLDPLKQELNAKLTGKLGTENLPDNLKAMPTYYGETSGLYTDQIKEIQTQIADLEDTALRLTDKDSDFVSSYTQKIESLISSGASRDDIAKKVNTFLIGVAADNFPTVGSRLGRVGSEIVMCSARIQPFMPVPNISGKIPKDYAELTELVDSSKMSKTEKDAYKADYIMWDQELRSREKILTLRSYSPYDRVDPVTNFNKGKGNREKNLLTLHHEWETLEVKDQGGEVGRSRWGVTDAGRWFQMLESAYNEGYGHNAIELMERLTELEGVGELTQETFPRHAMKAFLDPILAAEAKDPDKARWAKAIRTVADSPIQGPDKDGPRDVAQRITSKVTSFEFMRTLAGTTSTLKIPFVDEPIPISKPVYLRIKYAPWQNYIKPVMSQMQRAWLTGGELGPPKPEDVTTGILSIKRNWWFGASASPLPEGAGKWARIKENLFGEDSLFNRAPAWLKAPARIGTLGLLSHPASVLASAGLNTEIGRKFWKITALSTGLVTAGTYGVEYGTAAAGWDGFDKTPGWNIGVNLLKPVVRAGVGVSDIVLDDWAGGVSRIYGLKDKDGKPMLSFDIGGAFDEADKEVSNWINGRPSSSSINDVKEDVAPEKQKFFFERKKLKVEWQTSVVPQTSSSGAENGYNVTSMAFNDTVLNAKQMAEISKPTQDLNKNIPTSTFSIS